MRVITLARALDECCPVTPQLQRYPGEPGDGTDDAKADFVLTVTADGPTADPMRTWEILDFEDVHSSNDGTEIAYKLDIGYYTLTLGQGDTHR